MDKKDSSPLLSLLAHPDFPSQAVRRLAAGAELTGPDSLSFQYVLEADPRQVRIPPPVAQAGRAEQLWAHTCFEAFARVEGSPAYWELNFAPSGQWAVYRFDAYRRGMAPAELGSVPRVRVQTLDRGLELQAEVRLGAALPAPLRVALSTVVEDQEGRLSYWALRHPSGRPDFHHPESFSLALELPIHP